MSTLPPELIDRMRKSVEEYDRVAKLVTPLGFTLCTRTIFYGEPPFSIYCCKMEDYQSLIDNVDSIKEEYLKNKKRSLGFREGLFD